MKINWTNALKSIPAEWALTPVKDKRPLRPDWQSETAIARDELINLMSNGQQLISSKGKPWHCYWNGVGLRTGIVSGGLVAIDMDGRTSQPYMLSHLSNYEELPRTVAWTSGRPGRSQHIYRVPQQYWSAIANTEFKTGAKGEDGEVEQVELRWDGCQSVLPPSVHPITGQYCWLVGCAPWECEVAEAPQWVVEKMLKPAADTNSKKSTASNKTNRSEHYEQWSDTDWALSYLNALSSSRAEDYEDWVAVGMALHSVDDSLLREWDAWSTQSSKYKPGDCDRKWKSFKRSGVAIGTLAHMAKSDGWKSPFQEEPHYRDASGNGGDGKRHRASDDQPSDSQSLYKDFLSRVQLLLQYKDADEYKFHRSKLARNFSYRTEDIDDLIRRKLMPEDKKERRIYDLAELRDMPQFALEWLIPGILPRGESLLFSAEAKMGKTLLSDDLIFHIITGEDDFLGVGAQTKTGRVLKISVDESVQSTVLKAEKRYGPTWLESNRVRLVTDWKLTEQDFLETQIDEFNPDLVVIDSLRQVAANIGISENSAEFVDAIASVIKLCRRKNVSLVVIHHDNKNKESQGIDRARGSSSLPAAFWGILRLDPFPITSEEGEGKQKKQVIKFDPQDTRRLLALTARDVASQRLQIDLELENHHWLNKGEIGEDDATIRADFEERIVNMLKIHNRPLSTGDLLDIMEIEISQKRTLHRAIDKLVAKRIVNKVKGDLPVASGRPSWRYSLPPSLSPDEKKVSQSPKIVDEELSQIPKIVDEFVTTEVCDKSDQRKNGICDTSKQVDEREGGKKETSVATAMPERGQTVTIYLEGSKYWGQPGVVRKVLHQQGVDLCDVKFSDRTDPIRYLVKDLKW